MKKKYFPSVHPGEILREEFMADYNLTAYALAKSLHVPRDRIESLIREKRGITADTALRLAKYFGNSPQFWMNMQSLYNLEKARTDLAGKVENITPLQEEEIFHGTT